jgi:hypothetical protein
MNAPDILFWIEMTTWSVFLAWFLAFRVEFIGEGMISINGCNSLTQKLLNMNWGFLKFQKWICRIRKLLISKRCTMEYCQTCGRKYLNACNFVPCRSEKLSYVAFSDANFWMITNEWRPVLVVKYLSWSPEASRGWNIYIYMSCEEANINFDFVLRVKFQVRHWAFRSVILKRWAARGGYECWEYYESIF